ncbi:MAG: hypothetical protein ABR503_09475, partial [Chitinophagaceae bacterium]
MEREIKNNRDSIDTSLSDERTEALAASEMADRGPKAIDTTKGDWPDADGKTTLMGVSNPDEEVEDDEDDDEEDTDFEDDEDIDVAAPADTELDTVEIDDADIEDDLDIELD